MRCICLILAFTVALTGSGFARAGRPAGGGRPAGTSAQRPAGASAQRPSGGFNLSQDAKRPSTMPARPANPSGSRPAYNPNANRPANPNVNNINKQNVNVSGNTVNRQNINVSGNTINRNVTVNNPVYRGGAAWGWNRGVVWVPAAGYYGGGFWGAWAIGVTSAAVYGSIVNSYNRQTYTSYQVQQSSPGATLLSNYQLTQTQCGPPNLVVIYGPNNSVICAYPNNLVAAGNYNLNTQTLSLTSS